jgi:hypothetical protein
VGRRKSSSGRHDGLLGEDDDEDGSCSVRCSPLVALLLSIVTLVSLVIVYATNHDSRVQAEIMNTGAHAVTDSASDILRVRAEKIACPVSCVSGSESAYDGKYTRHPTKKVRGRTSHHCCADTLTEHVLPRMLGAPSTRKMITPGTSCGSPKTLPRSLRGGMAGADSDNDDEVVGILANLCYAACSRWVIGRNLGAKAGLAYINSWGMNPCEVKVMDKDADNHYSGWHMFKDGSWVRGSEISLECTGKR